ncbi:MAG: hypothetical protein KKF48_01335 [Nanoarchaeota archaeon]|nr:hypothetical protein [Nanoarchaeota archaeon]MBU1027665.1 hypothetical protein [Nanoarchaeota archaeon]
MLTDKQIKEIKLHLEKAQNPLFLFDNDPDGLCSFLLLQRYIERGKGFPIKSFPELKADYIRKINELNADYVFILDKPVIEKEFWEEIHKINIPVVWIDHHGIQGETPDFVSYYDPVLNNPSTNEPVTALCYQITQRKKDIWLAVIGCISDAFLPDFYKDFQEKYPDLAVDAKKPFDVLYKSEIGRLGKIMGNGLKDKTTNVIAMLKFLMKVKNPYEALEETSQNYLMHKRFNEVEQKYQNILEKAKKVAESSEKILFFKYAGDLSMSGELSNELRYNFPDKIIVVAHIKPDKVNLSIRGKKIREKYLKIIKSIESARGGGHEDAVGGQMSFGDLEKFRKKFEEEFG